MGSLAMAGLSLLSGVLFQLWRLGSELLHCICFGQCFVSVVCVSCEMRLCGLLAGGGDIALLLVLISWKPHWVFCIPLEGDGRLEFFP